MGYSTVRDILVKTLEEHLDELSGSGIVSPFLEQPVCLSLYQFTTKMKKLMANTDVSGILVVTDSLYWQRVGCDHLIVYSTVLCSGRRWEVIKE